MADDTSSGSWLIVLSVRTLKVEINVDFLHCWRDVLVGWCPCIVLGEEVSPSRAPGTSDTPPWCCRILFLAEEVSPSPEPGTGNTPTLPWHPSCEGLTAPCTPLYCIGCTVMVGWIDKSIDSWTFLMRIASSTLRRIVGQDLRSSHLPLCSSLCQRLVYESYARGRQEEHQSNGFLLLAAQPVHSAYKTKLDFLLGFLPLADCLAGLTSFSYPCFYRDTVSR